MDYLKRYQKMISLRGLTDHTMKSYQTYISVYLNYIENTLHKTPSQVSYKDQRRFLEILQNKRNLSDRYAILSKQTLDCLGKYTHRIAISNHRIIRMDDETVTSFVKDYRNKGEWKELTISGIEFIRRFLMHVPPKRFVRIRHYGLLCSRSKRKKLTLCRNLLGCQKYLSKLRDKEMPEILKQLYGINVCVCKSCGSHLGKPQLRIPQRC